MNRLGTKLEAMQQVKDQVLAFSTSPLHKLRIKEGYLPVIGEGSADARIIFIGEAPGKKEALSGKPFCGASGRILDELLQHINLKRKDVYITSILKDRPPENRDPKPEEIEMYAPFLDTQIEIIEPKIIATLGRFSMEYCMKKYQLESLIKPISKIRGKVFEVESSFGSIKIVPLFHPAVALYSPSRKDELKKDFEILKKHI